MKKKKKNQNSQGCLVQKKNNKFTILSRLQCEKNPGVNLYIYYLKIYQVKGPFIP